MKTLRHLRLLLRTSLPVFVALTLVSSSARAATATWQNIGTDFNLGSNWSGGSGTGGAPGAGDTALFNTRTKQPNLTASLSIGGLEFSSTSASGWDLTANSGQSLTLTSIGTGAASAVYSGLTNSLTNTLDAPLILGAASGATQTITQNQVGGVSGTLVLNGKLSSTNSINLNYSVGTAGIVTINGVNDYIGTTNLGTGTTVIGNKAAFGTSTVTTGGTVQASSDVSGANAVANSFTLLTTTFSGTNNIELSGTVNSDGAHPVTNSISGGILKLSGTVNIFATDTAGKTFTLNGAGNTTISGTLNDNAAGTHTNPGNLTYSGSGTLKLSGANTYSGLTSINGGGAITVSSLNSVSGGSATSSLGAPTTAANGTITLGNSASSGTLIYTGSGETTDRVVKVNGAGGGILQADGSGALNFTSDANATTAATYTLTLQGSSTANNTIGGVKNGSNAANVTSVAKAGSGTWVLSSGAGGNTYTGNTTVTGGTLKVGGSTALGFGGNYTLGETTGDTSVSNGTLDLNGQSAVNEAITLNGGNLVNNSGTTATLQNGVAEVEFSGGGSGYAGAISVAFSGGGGTGAAATAAVTSGAVSRVTTTTSGSGYTSAPSVAINGSTGGSGSATATAILSSVTLSGTSNNIGGSGDLAVNAVISGSGGGFAKTGGGVLTLAGANTYTGGTTVSAGKVYVNTTTGSGTGTSSVGVSGGATLAGRGFIRPTSGTGVTVASGGNLASGTLQVSDATHDTVNGTRLTLDNTGNLSNKILSVNSGSTLTFSLGAGASTGTSFATPNLNSTYLNVLGNSTGEVTFDPTSAINIHLVDLTSPFASPTMNDTLQLRFQNAYLLIQTGTGLTSDDSNFANLVTTGGLDQNGYVLGVGTSTSSYTPFNITMTDINGNALTYPYNGLQLYLYNGDLEVIPEPGTWAMMLGGLALLIVIQRRKAKHISV